MLAEVRKGNLKQLLIHKIYIMKVEAQSEGSEGSSQWFVVAARCSGLWRDRHDIDVLLSNMAVAEELPGMTVSSISRGNRKISQMCQPRAACTMAGAGKLECEVEASPSFPGVTLQLRT